MEIAQFPADFIAFCGIQLGRIEPISRTSLCFSGPVNAGERVVKHGYNVDMVNFFKLRRMTVWIACFAILLNALAPSLSHAMSALSGTSSLLTEVCTANGTKLIAAVAEKAPDSALKSNGDQKKNLAASGHCPFCLPHDGSVSLLPTGAISFALSAKHGLMPSLFYQSPQPLFSWAVAHPRDPPVAS